MKKLIGIVATISAVSLPSAAIAANMNGNNVVDATATLGLTEALGAAKEVAMLTDIYDSDSLSNLPTPNNELLTELPKGALTNQNKPETTEQVFGLVRFHTLDSEVMLQDFLRSMPSATNLTNTTLPSDGELTQKADSITVAQVGIDASYDGIHPADKVVLPSNRIG